MNTEAIAIRSGQTARPATCIDAQALAHLVRTNIEHLRTYLPAVTALAAPDVALDHLQELEAAIASGDAHEWHLFDGEELCGGIRLNHIEAGNRKASIGYYIGIDHQGKGLATAAVRAVLRHCFDRLEFNRIEIKCATGNVASQRVAQRLGFVREGLLRQAEWLHGRFVDHYVYGLLREEFAIANAR